MSAFLPLATTERKSLEVRFVPKAANRLLPHFVARRAGPSHPKDVSVCAMCGRLRVGKTFFHVLQHWSVQPCVRPFDAVHMTAGHNALRGSGPDQHLAFKI